MAISSIDAEKVSFIKFFVRRFLLKTAFHSSTTEECCALFLSRFYCHFLIKFCEENTKNKFTLYFSRKRFEQLDLFYFGREKTF